MSNTPSLETRPVSALFPSPYNTKLHPEEQIQKIAQSILQNGGFLDPIEIDVSGEIIVGEGRWRAAKLAGLDAVPVIVRNMTQEQRRAYSLAHNQTTLMTGLDLNVVAGEFERLGFTEDDYGAAGFTPDEVIFMLPEQTSITQNDEISSPTMDTSTWEDLVPKTIRSRVLFKEQIQQARFEQFAEKLREMFPAEPLLSSRLEAFIDRYAPEGAL